MRAMESDSDFSTNSQGKGNSSIKLSADQRVLLEKVDDCIATCCNLWLLISKKGRIR